HIAGLIELVNDSSVKIGNLWLTEPTPSLTAREALLAGHSATKRRLAEAARSQPRLLVLQESLRQGCELVRLAEIRKISVASVQENAPIGPLKVLSPTADLQQALRPETQREFRSEANLISIEGSSDSQKAAQVIIETAVSISNEMSTILWTDFQAAFPGGF